MENTFGTVCAYERHAEYAEVYASARAEARHDLMWRHAGTKPAVVFAIGWLLEPSGRPRGWPSLMTVRVRYRRVYGWTLTRRGVLRACERADRSQNPGVART